jgi:hypothetical protein
MRPRNSITRAWLAVVERPKVASVMVASTAPRLTRFKVLNVSKLNRNVTPSHGRRNSFDTEASMLTYPGLRKVLRPSLPSVPAAGLVKRTGGVPEAQAERRRAGTRLVGSVAYYPEKYGDQLIPLAISIVRGAVAPPATFVRHELVTPANVHGFYGQAAAPLTSASKGQN